MRNQFTLIALLAQSACDKDGDVYSLYRSSVFQDIARIHVATFDANEPGNYNRDNCMSAADLFAAQPGVTVRYWCEKGRPKK